jgi:hypothetical protein
MEAVETAEYRGCPIRPERLMATTRHSTGYLREAETWSARVLDGSIPACSWVRLAVERQQRDLAKYKGRNSPYYFDREAGEYVCAIAEHFPHIKGVWARSGDRLVLSPWQCFITPLFSDGSAPILTCGASTSFTSKSQGKMEKPQ